MGPVLSPSETSDITSPQIPSDRAMHNRMQPDLGIDPVASKGTKLQS